MSFVALGVAVVGGAAKLISAGNQRRQRQQEQQEANKQMAMRQKQFDNLKISNPYENLENTYEDLTINQQQAEYMTQQNAINQANTMEGMRQAAGGAGVAGLAQAMANQGQQAAEKVGTMIGQQEAANQARAAQGEAARQSAVASGEVGRQTRQKAKTSDQLEMAMGRKQAADDARSAAATQAWQGVGEIAGGVASWGQGNLDDGMNFWGNPK